MTYPEDAYGAQDYDDHDDDGLGVEYDPAAGYGHAAQAPYVDPSVLQGLSSAMYGIAAETARQQLAEPLAALTHEAQMRENARIEELVDGAVEILAERLPGFDPRSEEFVNYAERQGAGEGAVSSKALAAALEEAAIGFNAIQQRRQQAERQQSSAREFARIKSQQTSFRVP